MKEALVKKAYEVAKERYAEIGVDTEKILEQLQNFHLSLHCWQADDVKGFEVQAGALSGGIQSTGDFPGAARNIDELRSDILKAKSLIPGNHRLNLHEIYGDFKGKVVDRDEVTIEYFQSWIDWAKENNTLLDFNSSSFSHPKSGSLSLANPDESIRKFWVEHTKRCRDIANAMGEAQNDPCIMNLWVHDGCKDMSVNHALYRNTLKKSLDEVFEIFVGTQAVLGDENLVKLQQECDTYKEQLNNANQEILDLKQKCTELEIDLRIAKKEIELKDQIIAVHDYYTKKN